MEGTKRCRVESTGVWAWSGAKSSADWLANVSGTELRTAIETVEVARAIESLPATEAVLREGRLSSAPAVSVTRAAVKDPGSEERLWCAARMSMGDLKREAKRVNAAARTGESEAEKARRQRALRSVSFWNDDEGMACASLRLEPKYGIAFRRRIERAADQEFNAARKLGVRDTSEQYAADAFVALFGHVTADTSPSPEPVVAARHVEMITVNDYNALVRGELEPGERCEIPGVGPIPVSLARDYLLGGAFLKVLITHRGYELGPPDHNGTCQLIPPKNRSD